MPINNNIPYIRRVLGKIIASLSDASESAASALSIGQLRQEASQLHSIVNALDLTETAQALSQDFCLCTLEKITQSQDLSLRLTKDIQDQYDSLNLYQTILLHADFDETSLPLLASNSSDYDDYCELTAHQPEQLMEYKEDVMLMKVIDTSREQSIGVVIYFSDIADNIMRIKQSGANILGTGEFLVIDNLTPQRESIIKNAISQFSFISGTKYPKSGPYDSETIMSIIDQRGLTPHQILATFMSQSDTPLQIRDDVKNIEWISTATHYFVTVNLKNGGNIPIEYDHLKMPADHLHGLNCHHYHYDPIKLLTHMTVQSQVLGIKQGIIANTGPDLTQSLSPSDGDTMTTKLKQSSCIGDEKSAAIP